MQLLDAMVKVDEDTKLNWRIQQALATTFASLPEYLTAQEMHDRVAPIVFRLLGPEVAAAVRRPAAEALVRVIRMPELKVQQRTDLYLRVIKEFAKGKSFWQRSIFVDICDSLLHIFSTKFFREHFFGPCIDLMSDPVPNIRLKVCELLPDLKQTIRLPDDVEFLDRLNTAVSGLMTDNDRDVSMRARAMNDAFKSKPFRMARAAVSSGSGGFEAEVRRRPGRATDLSQLLRTRACMLRRRRRCRAQRAACGLASHALPTPTSRAGQAARKGGGVGGVYQGGGGEDSIPGAGGAQHEEEHLQVCGCCWGLGGGGEQGRVATDDAEQAQAGGGSSKRRSGGGDGGGRRGGGQGTSVSLALGPVRCL